MELSHHMEKGYYIHGFSLYGEMQRNQYLKLSPYTYVAMLKACIALKDVKMGSSIHAEICRTSLSDSDIFIATTLVDMYSKCGCPFKAEEVFFTLPYRDVVLWTVLIAAHVERGHDEEAIVCIQTMQDEDVSPDAFTYVCGLRACSSLGAIEKGQEIHSQIVVKGVECELLVANTLMDMYVKSGELHLAKGVFDEIKNHNAVSWNTMVGGYAKQGQGHEAMTYFEKMQRKGLSPDEVTFLCVLGAFSNSGLSDEAEMLFGDMSRTYGLTPCIQHNIWMIVVFGYGGHFDKAISVIKVMPCTDCLAVWVALLGACRKWGNVMLGTVAFDQITQLDCTCATAYVLMCSIFASAGMHEDAENVETMRLKYAS